MAGEDGMSWETGTDVCTLPCVKQMDKDIPGGPVVKSPSANAGDLGLIPGPRRPHMPWSH